MQVSKTQFKADTQTLYPDNTSGDISPADLRAQIDNIADSVPFIKTQRNAPPSTSDDANGSAGNGSFNVGDLWVDEANNTMYACLDNAVSAAIWYVVASLPNNYSTRALFVAANTAVPGLRLLDGQVVVAGGLEYRRSSTSTIISGLPGWVPNRRWEVGHFGDNTTPGTTNMTAIIQAGIDALSAAGGGTLWVPKAVFGVSGSVTSLGRQVALLLKPNVILDGEGTIRRIGTNMAFGLIQGVGTGTFPDVTQTMGVRGITLDGASQNRVDGLAGSPGITNDGFNLWMFKVKNPVIENIISLNSPSWGIRIQQCIGGASINNISTDHGPDVNADGVHFIDCRDLTGNGFNILTRGDDGFVVEANSFDNSNLQFTGVNVQCPLGVTAAGRGVLVFRETLSSTAPLVIENIKIEAVARNCGGPSNAGGGLVINTANTTLRNSVFDIQSDRCTRGAQIFAGDQVLPGTIENCVFRLVDSNSSASMTQFGIATGITGVFDGNRAEVMVFNPADGQTGVSIVGNKWSGHVIVDYNPNANKVSPGNGVSLLVTQSSLFVDCKGANRNLVIANGSSFNTIYLGNLRDAVLRDIELGASAVDTIFIGGSVSSTILGATTATRFVGTQGANNTVFVGDFGVGSINLQLVTNWDDITLRSGLYGTTSSTTSGTVPGGFSGFDLTGTMQFDTLNGGTFNQTWISAGSRTFWFRRYTSGAWGAWIRLQQAQAGTTAGRPTTGLVPGLSYFDTTLGIPIWRNGANTAWVNHAGTTV
jgi:hypothetical protein